MLAIINKSITLAVLDQIQFQFHLRLSIIFMLLYVTINMSDNYCEMVIVGEEFDCGVVGDDCRTVGCGGGQLYYQCSWWWWWDFRHVGLVAAVVGWRLWVSGGWSIKKVAHHHQASLSNPKTCISEGQKWSPIIIIISWACHS